MKRYLAKQIVSLVPVLLVSSLVAFLILKLIPGDPADAIAGFDAGADEIERIRVQLGLDKPWYVQLGRWYSSLLQGNLGNSLALNVPVTTAIAERLPVTLSLAALSMVISVPIGILAGAAAGYHRNTILDRAVMVGALAGVSLPNFWIGVMGILLFAVVLGWLPFSGYTPLAEGVWPWLRSLILPSLVLGTFQMGLIARITRASMIEVLRMDFIRTARMKGASEARVVVFHALPNAMIPVVTVIGTTFSLVMGGAVIVEQVFSLPGVGRLVVQGIFSRDYPVVQGVLMASALIFVATNLFVDVLYTWFDPRVRYDE